MSELGIPAATGGALAGGFAKRALDLVLACLGLLLLSPLLLLVALAVRLDSPGPALYAQPRAGVGGKPFRLYKFRSMYAGCAQEAHREASAAWFRGEPGRDGFKSRRDPRVTRLGAHLRALSVDELPQLINVVRGEMSLVGPRPLMPYDRALYEPWHFERELVRPGITGPWQVSGRSDLSAAEMMRLDVLYVRERSFRGDVALLLRTVPAVLGRRGA